jgi:hypothetical protein
MKKALAILMIFALVASVAVAEVSIGAWGRGIFLPVNSGPVNTVTDTAPSWGGWGGDEARIGFTLAGNSDNVGFQIDGNVDGGAFSMGDQQKIWVKPMDMVTLQLGRIYDDTLRGNAAYGSFNWYRGLGNGDGEDVTFTRIGFQDAREGFEVAVAPMDNLYAALYFYDLDKDLVSAMFAHMQFALGYTIDGVGQLKAQVYTAEGTRKELDADDLDDGKIAEVDDMQTTIEIAFNYTGVENLFVELGFAMATNNDVRTDITSFLNFDADVNEDGEIDDDEKITVEEYKKIALYAKYNMDAMTIHFSSINRLFKAVDTEVLYKLIAGLDYDLGEGVGVEADVSYLGTTVDDIDGVVTFFAGAKKGFSNGVIGAGVQVKNDGSDTYFGIPIRMEYWF